MKKISLIPLTTLVVGGAAFSPTAIIAPSSLSRASPLSAVTSDNDTNESRIKKHTSMDIFATLATRTVASAAVSLAILTSPLHNTATNSIAHADEWGTETEAPTLFTGETVMICKKRGVLGACKETSVRTVENDNDKALKYFVDPSAKVKARQQQMLSTVEKESEGNALVQKLRKQSADNKEKNDQTVLTRTLINDQGASFGPFNSQVVILNTDGRSFTLLQNPQAMRLKKAGYIEDKKFVIQPTQDVIDEALEDKEDLGSAIKGFFGGKGEEEVKVEAAAEISAVVVDKAESSDVAVDTSAVVVDKAESSAVAVDTAAVGDESVASVEEVASDSN